MTKSEAKRVDRQIELLCPKIGFTGQPIEPKLPAVREAMADGAISTEHVDRIAQVLDRVPEVYYEQVDAELADAARRFNPTGLSRVGQRPSTTARR